MAFDIATAVVKLDVVGAAAAANKIDDVGRRMQTFGRIATIGITAPLLAAGAGAIKLAADLEQTSIKFETLLGSATRASVMLKDLRTFANSTPFGFRELSDAAGRMLALGTSARDVLPTLRAIGDASAALGGGTEGVNGMIRALGQMRAKGSVQAEEMMQLAERGVNGWKYLAKTLNTDVAGAMEMVRKKQVDANTAIKSITAGMKLDFGGMMARQAETAAGKFSNLKDKIATIGTEIGTKLLPPVVKLMEWLNKLLERFDKMPEAAKNLMLIGAGAAAVAPPVMSAAGSIYTAHAVGALAAGGGAAMAGTRGGIGSKVDVAGLKSYAGMVRMQQKAHNATQFDPLNTRSPGMEAWLAKSQKLDAELKNVNKTIEDYSKQCIKATTQTTLAGRAMEYLKSSAGKTLIAITLITTALLTVNKLLDDYRNKSFNAAQKDRDEAAAALEVANARKTQAERLQTLIERYQELEKTGGLDPLKKSTIVSSIAIDRPDLVKGDNLAPNALSVVKKEIKGIYTEQYKDAMSAATLADETVKKNDDKIAELRDINKMKGPGWLPTNLIDKAYAKVGYYPNGSTANIPERIKSLQADSIKQKQSAVEQRFLASYYKRGTSFDEEEAGLKESAEAAATKAAAQAAARRMAKAIANETASLTLGELAKIRLDRDVALDADDVQGEDKKAVRQAIWSKYDIMVKHRRNEIINSNNALKDGMAGERLRLDGKPWQAYDADAKAARNKLNQQANELSMKKNLSEEEKEQIKLLQEQAKLESEKILRDKEDAKLDMYGRERTAKISAMTTALTLQGRTYEALREQAKATRDAELIELDRLAKKGEDVYYRRQQAEASYLMTLKNINDELAMQAQLENGAKLSLVGVKARLQHRYEEADVLAEIVASDKQIFDLNQRLKAGENVSDQLKLAQAERATSITGVKTGYGNQRLGMIESLMSGKSREMVKAMEQKQRISEMFSGEQAQLMMMAVDANMKQKSFMPSFTSPEEQWKSLQVAGVKGGDTNTALLKSIDEKLGKLYEETYSDNRKVESDALGYIN
ncbi:MAG: tape measure protein [Armatimonadota bacterium]